MSKYFAKYLPVEGEIEDGDKYLTEKGELYSTTYITESGHEGTIDRTHDKKAKLFLCSRDIQVGDKYMYIDETNNNSIHQGLANIIEVRENEIIFDNKTFLYKREVFKVIGEISSEATWVKEGDEFNQEQWKKEVGFFETIRIKIKGPCGHYH